MKRILIFTLIMSTAFFLSCEKDKKDDGQDEDQVSDTEIVDDDAQNEDETTDDPEEDDDEKADEDQEESECVGISLSGIMPASQYASTYGSHYTPNTGSDAEDALMIEFITPVGPGEYDLGSGRNSNYGTCEQCILLSEDIDDSGIAKRFFQESGKLVLINVIQDEAGYMTAESKGSISKVKLIEVTLEARTLNSIPVENGKCYEIEFAEWNSLTTQPDCTNKECGDDGAGGFCGQCEEGNICESGKCVTCTPDCSDKVCGDDGCGGSCGSCEFGSTCSSDGSECSACEEIILKEDSFTAPNVNYVSTIFTPSVGDENKLDEFRIEFNNKQLYKDEDIDLASSINSNYQTCEQCLLVLQDYELGTASKIFFQSSGIINIDEMVLWDSGLMKSESRGTMKNVMLEEVTISDSNISTPVQDGSCVVIKEADWDTMCYPSCKNEDGSDKTCGSDGCGGICGTRCGVGQVCNEEQTACVDRVCETITVEGTHWNDLYEAHEYYIADVSPELGRPTDYDNGHWADQLRIEFKPDVKTLGTGTYDLASADNIQADTCKNCVTLAVDPWDDDKKLFFQEAGTMTIDDFGEKGKVSGTLTDVRLIEVTLKATGHNTDLSTPVPGGSCYLIESASFDTICTPSCENKVCGDDGCGGSCGTCETGMQCSSDQSACEDACASITLDEIEGKSNFMMQNWYESTYTPQTGSSAADKFKMEFANTKTGGICNIKDISCERTLTVLEDDEAKKYLGIKGIVNVTDFTPDAYGFLATESKGTLDKILLVEVDGSDNQVENGSCLRIESASWNTMCTPDCENKVCGDDGCGGTCGTCSDGSQCSADQSVCEKICTAVTLEEIAAERDFMWRNIYSASYTPNTGAADQNDKFEMMFNNSVEKGNCDMSDSGTCFSFFKITEDGTKTYLPKSGTVTLEDFNPDAYGDIALESQGQMSEVVLSEVDSENNFVDNGECLKIASATWNTMPSCVADCENKVCGDDGCGGSCGTCGDGETCSEDQSECAVNSTCSDLLLPTLAMESGTAKESLYKAQFNQIGDTGEMDVFEMKLNEAAAGTTYDLMSAANTDYYYCKQCVEMRVDTDTDNIIFIPSQGSVRVDAVSADNLGQSQGELLNVTLVEAELVYVNPYDFFPTPIPVEGGACYNVKGATTWNTMP